MEKLEKKIEKIQDDHLSGYPRIKELIARKITSEIQSIAIAFAKSFHPKCEEVDEESFQDFITHHYKS